MNTSPIFRRLDTNVIDGRPSECRVIMVVRNEGDRLPWILEYYRQLGVDRFFIVDNGSTDGTISFLAQQKDCHVFLTDESYAASGSGVAWQKRIMKQFGGNHWWLLVDADEMFVYPSSETVSLRAFCHYLDSVGAEGVYATMLDMYSRAAVADTVYKPGQPYIEAANCFDTEYAFRPRIRLPFMAKPFPRDEPIGGPRLRRFYPEFYNVGRAAIAKVKALRRLRDWLRRRGLKLNIDCAVPPILFKVPLLKDQPGLQIYNSHVVSPLRLAPVTGALLHFKFFSDFHERVMREVGRREHFDGASEYARYLRVMESEPRMSFYHEKSATYESTDQLVKLGLIRDDTSFQAYRLANPPIRNKNHGDTEYDRKAN